MAKKRTKKQKARATYHYAFPANKSFVGLDSEGTAAAVVNVPKRSSDVTSLYQYDPRYTRIDLKKTLLITLIMVAVEIGVYFWL